MKTKKEIQNELSRKGAFFQESLLIVLRAQVEVLIDIRDILAEPTREKELVQMQHDATKGRI